MTANPLVSVILPTYKRPQYLSIALKSALAQTYRQLQVIVSDNASGDETASVVSGFSDERIFFLESAENIGGIRNFNKCIESAEGKYLMMLSDDDIISPNYVECMVRLMERNLSILAYGSTCVIDPQGEVIRFVKPDGDCHVKGVDLLNMWCSGRAPMATPFCFFAITEKVKLLGGVPSFPSGDNADNALMTALALQGSVSLTNECTYYYRQHPGNDSRSIHWALRAGSVNAFLEYMNQPALNESWKLLPAQEEKQLKEKIRHILVDSYLVKIFYSYHEKMRIGETLRAALGVPLGLSNYEVLHNFIRHEFYMRKERAESAVRGLKSSFWRFKRK